MMELNHAEVLFRIGTLGFERTHLQKIAESAPDVTLVSLATGIRPVIGTTCTHGHTHNGECMDSSDPHMWMSPASMKVLAANVCATLSAIDSTKKTDFTARLARFEMRMDSLDNRLKRELSGVSQRTFLIFHPALGYFARDYGLRQLSVEQDGKTPSAESMQQLIATAKAEGVKVVFVSEEHEGKAARRIAEAIGARIVSINPLSANWEVQMLSIAKALKDEH